MNGNIDSKLLPDDFFIEKEIRFLALAVSAFVLLFFTAIVIISNLLFFAGFRIHALVLPCSFILASALTWIILSRKYKQWAPIAFLVVFCSIVVIAAFSLAVAGIFYDASWDGQDYHQPAVIALADGWNPVYQIFPRAVTFDSEAPIWIDHYPKASWILQANIYLVTGFIELGKSINLMFLFVTMLLVFAGLCAYGRFKLVINILFSVVIASTPVFCYQFLSFYVDCLVSCIVISQFALAALILFDEKNSWPLWMLAIFVAFAINIKFTGIAFSFVTAAGLLVFLFVKYKKPGTLVKPALVLACAAIFAIFFVGFNPYVTNTMTHGHPLHPIFGNEARDVVTNQKPANFVNMNPIGSFFFSLVAESGTEHQQNGPGFNPASLKMPFTITKNDIRFSNSDPRSGGFGTMFSGMLILSLLLFIVHAIRLIVRKRIGLLFVHAGIIFWILASVLVIPDSWWARWVPQLWILPFVIILMSGGIESQQMANGVRKKIHFVTIPVMALRVAIVALAFVNNGIILGYYISLYSSVSKSVHAETAKLALHKGDVAVFAYKFDGAVNARIRDTGCKPYYVDYIYGADYKDVLSNSTSFGYVMIGIPRVSRTEVEKYAQADMPAGIVVVDPDSSVPESARVFSGVWKGKVSAVIDTIIVVSGIRKDLSADVVVSLGGYKPGKLEKKSYRVSGTIDIGSPSSLHIVNDDLEISLLSSDDLNSVEIIASRTNADGTGYLRKINTAINKPYLDSTRVSGTLLSFSSNDLPLPEGIKMIEPDPSLPDSLKIFAGVWEGKLPGEKSAAVLITKITDTDVEIIVSWGSFGATPGGFVSMVGQVVMNDPPEIHANNAYGMKFRMIPGANENTAEAQSLVRWYNFSSVFLHKRTWTEK